MTDNTNSTYAYFNKKCPHIICKYTTNAVNYNVYRKLVMQTETKILVIQKCHNFIYRRHAINTQKNINVEPVCMQSHALYPLGCDNNASAHWKLSDNLPTG